MEEKRWFLKLSLYMQAKTFQTYYSFILYYGYSHAHDHLYIPNRVYNSLYVRDTVFFYNYNFRERYDVGVGCNIAIGVGCNIAIGVGCNIAIGVGCNIAIGVGCNIAIGAGCNTVIVEQMAYICGMNRANNYCDIDTKVGMWHFYSYQIHSVRLANRKSKMAAIFQDGHGQINFTL